MKINVDLPDLNFEQYQKVKPELIKLTTLEGERICKMEAPYITGTLRAAHSSIIEPEKGVIINSTNYWQYVVFGRGMVKPVNANVLHWTDKDGEHFAKSVKATILNNYPRRAADMVFHEFDKLFKQALKNAGVE